MYKDVFTKRVPFVCCCCCCLTYKITSIQERYIKSEKYGRGRGGGVTLITKCNIMVGILCCIMMREIY